MLKITKKLYEIEENIQITENKDGKEEILLDIPMQITSDELLKLKRILFVKENKENNQDEEIADICFKENKEKIKEIAGDYKYEELLGDVKGFFLGFFIEKQIQPMNTTITDLTKIMNNFRGLR